MEDWPNLRADDLHPFQDSQLACACSFDKPVTRGFWPGLFPRGLCLGISPISSDTAIICTRMCCVHMCMCVLLQICMLLGCETQVSKCLLVALCCSCDASRLDARDQQTLGRIAVDYPAQALAISWQVQHLHANDTAVVTIKVIDGIIFLVQQLGLRVAASRA